MRSTRFILTTSLLLLTIILTSCNLPDNVTSPQTEEPAATFTAMRPATATVDVFGTQTQAAILMPTETPTLTVTATATEPAEPSETPTPEPILAEVVSETNCRTGPAGNYDLIATYQVGKTLEIVAKDLGAGYWFVRNPETTEEQCYLLAQNIKISGDPTALPQYTPPSSPTAAPYFDVELKKFDTCEGLNFGLFTVINKGSVPFRSTYIRLTDLKTSKSVEQALNAFDLVVKCVLAKNIAPLNPGETGYVQSGKFSWPVGSNTMRAVIMVCTEKDLKGTCVTRSLDVKP